MRLDLSRRTDGEVQREFDSVVRKDCHSTSEMLAYVGEVHARGLFRAKGYASMFKYCVIEKHMSEDVAWKRIQVARLARRFPVILDMIADGRLHLTSVVKLLPHKLACDFGELLEAATHKTKSELELLLAARFPQPDAPTVVAPLAMSAECQKLVPEPVIGTHDRPQALSPSCESASLGTPPTDPPGDGAVIPGQSGQPGLPSASPAPVLFAPPAQRARVQPLAPQRYAIQVTVGQATHDKLRRAQELLGHRVAAGDLEQVLDRALDALIRQLEHAKFAPTDDPRRAKSRATTGKRHIPAYVKRPCTSATAAAARL